MASFCLLSAALPALAPLCCVLLWSAVTLVTTAITAALIPIAIAIAVATNRRHRHDHYPSPRHRNNRLLITSVIAITAYPSPSSSPYSYTITFFVAINRCPITTAIATNHLARNRSSTCT